MKKFMALALSAVVALGVMTGCSSSNTTDDKETENTETTDTADRTQLIVGFDAEYPPYGYMDADGNYVGFDLDLAQEVCDRNGWTLVKQPIDWDTKDMELNSGSIDCIWNGMTITPELQEALTISDPYIKNYQVVVIRSDNADVYTSTADLVGKTVEAEAGSAGEAAIIGEGADESLKQAEYISAAKQTDTLLEVKTGAADAAVLDFVLAGAMVGQGDYSDLMIIPDLQLSVEEYGVGFRKDSDAAEKVNEAMQALIEDGTLNTLAEKYDLAELLLANQ